MPVWPRPMRRAHRIFPSASCAATPGPTCRSKGNVLTWGVAGAQKEAVMGARNSIVTVEEIVEDLNAPPNSVILPGWVVSAVCK